MHAAEERQWWYVGMRAITDALLAGRVPRAGADGRLPRLLDAGCGTGHNLRHLRDRARVLGIDLSTEALRFCRERRVEVARGSVLDLPLGAGSVQVVTSFDVLYHAWVTDDVQAVRELVRVLAPGGLLLVRVPALKMLWGAHDEAVHSRHRYTAGELRTLFESAGLEVVRTTYCNSLLFPMLAVRRTLDRLLSRHGSDVEFLPAPLEWLFLRLLLVEAFFVGKGFRFPIGASVCALGRKPAR